MKKQKYTFVIYLIYFSFLLSIGCSDKGTEPVENSPFDWPLSDPQTENVDPQKLDIAFTVAQSTSFINAIVIIRNGYLIAERYYNGFDRNDSHNIRSVSKSILSALIGIAISNGYIPSIETKIMEYFSEYASPGADERRSLISVKNLLTQQSGIDNDHNNYGLIFYSNNWIETTLELPLVADPGTEFNYTTAGTHLFSVLLTKVSGMSTRQFANQYLINYLDISVSEWQRDPQGYYFGGNNMYMSPRDLARFGYLYLHGGALNNTEIVSETWVHASLQDYQNRENWNWGELTNIGYGYLWWMGDIGGYHAKIAIGHGGQFIIIVPDLQLIIATSSYSDNLSWDAADIQERAVLDIVANYILPAVER